MKLNIDGFVKRMVSIQTLDGFLGERRKNGFLEREREH